MRGRPRFVAFDLIETVFSLDRLRDRLGGTTAPTTERVLWQGIARQRLVDPLIQALEPPVLARAGAAQQEVQALHRRQLSGRGPGQKSKSPAAQHG